MFLAHLVSTGAGPFYDGTAHFFITFEELLPVIALSFFAGLRGTRSARFTIAIIPIAWIIAGFVGVMFPTKQPPVILSTLLLLLPGILLASDWKLPGLPVFAIASLFGLILGFVNGAAMAEAGSGMFAVTGAASSALIVSVFGAALAVKLSSGWTRIVLRVAGSWLAALGLLTLGWALRK
jgi:hydrogenase/urease accessory protein HupE